MGLQSSTDQQREGQVCDVDAHNGKRVAGKSQWKYECKKLFFVCLVVFVVINVIFLLPMNLMKATNLSSDVKVLSEREEECYRIFLGTEDKKVLKSRFSDNSNKSTM